jgi:hypothetical protein
VERKEAVSLGLTHYNTGRPCKHGHIANRRVKDRVCMACDCAYQKMVSLKHPEQFKAYRKSQYIKHRETHLAQKRVYRQANKGKINALVSARKAYIKQRTPIWVDSEERWLIKEVYDLATKRTEMSGFAWHVDHIIPLQGTTVSGLHVINNLQVIPAVDNIRKKNKYAE